MSQKFQYNQPSPIVGEPNLQVILQFFKEIKRNAQCVPTNAGSGQQEKAYNQIPKLETINTTARFHIIIDIIKKNTP